MVDLRGTKKALDEAKRVLEENAVFKPPVMVDEIARNYGLSISSVFFPENNVAGFIDVSKNVIFINDADNESRKAFTIAHELGHWIMHKDELVSNEDYAVLYRKPIGVNGDSIEREANIFAANLLVPRQFLDKYKDNNISTIAKIFGVSVDVVGYRLKNEYGD